MVSVVVSEQALASEREQPIYLSQPVVQLLEMFFVTEGINGVSEAQPTRDLFACILLSAGSPGRRQRLGATTSASSSSLIFHSADPSWQGSSAHNTVRPRGSETPL